MKKTLSVLALLLSALAVLSFGAFSAYAENESAGSADVSAISEVSGASEASAISEASGASGASGASASSEASEASEASGEASGNASGDESQDAAAAMSKGGGFPWGLVTFLAALLIFVVICLICIRAKNRFGRWLRNFFRDYKSELKKVTWPSRELTLKSTVVVLVCLVVSGAVVGLLDFGLAKLVELLTYLVKK